MKNRVDSRHIVSPTMLKVLCAAVACALVGYLFFALHKTPIKIGILHSLTGPFAISEKPMVDAELLAIDEINQKGGIVGRKLLPIVVDTESKEKNFAYEAERLITQEKVSVIIGCWASTSRKAVLPVIEKYDNILLYPVAYEGIEESPNILYIGASANQQIIPAMVWSSLHLGKKFFLLGSDEIFSVTAHEILKDTAVAIGSTIVGGALVSVEATNFDAIIQKIKESQPDVILNSLQGDSNRFFFQALRAAGITPEKIPTMSFSSVSETEFQTFGSAAVAGDYVTANYFQSIEREQNTLFVSHFKKKYGAERVVSESVEAAYISVYLWADAVSQAKTAEPSVVKNHLHNRVINAPEGIVYTDSVSQGMWKNSYIGKLRTDGQFTIIWDTKKPVQPQSIPASRSGASWNEFIKNQYQKWGSAWSASSIY